MNETILNPFEFINGRLNSIENLLLDLKEQSSKKEKESVVKKKYYTGKEVDKILRCSPPTRYKHKNNGLIEAVKVGGKTLYTCESVDKMAIAIEAKNG